MKSKSKLTQSSWAGAGTELGKISLKVHLQLQNFSIWTHYTCLVQLLWTKMLLQIAFFNFVIVFLVVWTFVCTAWLVIIRNKSNIKKFIGIFIFMFGKQVSASALITSDIWLNKIEEYTITSVPIRNITHKYS